MPSGRTTAKVRIRMASEKRRKETNMFRVTTPLVPAYIPLVSLKHRHLWPVNCEGAMHRLGQPPREAGVTGDSAEFNPLAP